MKGNQIYIIVLGLVLTFSGCATKKNKEATKGKNVQLPANIKPLYVQDPQPYQPSNTKITDLIHTKLKVSFDWEKQYLYGVANLTLKPYFYPQSTVVLDAKGFDIDYIKLMTEAGSQDLSYQYDSLQLTIQLDKEYSREQFYELEIKYTSKPNELEEGGSKAITSDKGLYFINPLGEDKDKPRQIWTQGETEASSCWFPTIDSPNEKTTEEIYITVDTNFTTISNGLLIYSTDNGDGTKTDYWKQDKPHAPYLFMMTIGEFAEIKDSWKGLDVNYYVEKKYAPYARGVFGITPELLTFFSEKLGYEYPWDKYYQVAVRDYVSGAMENTSAAVFLEEIQLTDREQLDENWDYIIAHELFHHWFGDLVTCESWSNLALNESFANYSEYLWFEYKYGRDRADFHGKTEQEEYLQESVSKQVPIIRYNYHHREDMFDRHSYNKGGRVLHMLRKYVGDDAFFTALKNYLHEHEYTDVEIHELRLAFEETTGEDLNWFFNQWFLSPGHPELKVEHYYLGDTLFLNTVQLQDTSYTPLFKLPLDIEVWVDGEKTIYPIVIEQAVQQFKFPMTSAPNLVLFDAEQQLLGVINHKQSVEELIYQFNNSDKYLAKQEALLALLDESFDSEEFDYNPILDSTEVLDVFKQALNASFYDLRALAIESLLDYKGEDTTAIYQTITTLAESDKKASVRAMALGYLTSVEAGSQELYKQMLGDSAYSVVAAALSGYIKVGDESEKATIIEKYKDEEKLEIVVSVAQYYIDAKDTTQIDWFLSKFEKISPRDKIGFSQFFGDYVSKVATTESEKAVGLAEDLAKNHDHFYARFAGYKILWLLDSVEGVAAKRKQVIENETNKILIDAYERWESRIIHIGE